jgi:single-strand DNA-binding protein
LVNNVVLVGRLTHDPELKHTQNQGIAVCKFNIAVDRNFVNAQGNKEADFVDIVTWRKQAENCANYLKKGRLIAAVGRLQIRSYEDSNGVKRKAAEVVANQVKFLPDGKGNGNGNESPPTYSEDDIPF